MLDPKSGSQILQQQCTSTLQVTTQNLRLPLILQHFCPSVRWCSYRSDRWPGLIPGIHVRMVTVTVKEVGGLHFFSFSLFKHPKYPFIVESPLSSH